MPKRWTTVCKTVLGLCLAVGVNTIWSAQMFDIIRFFGSRKGSPCLNGLPPSAGAVHVLVAWRSGVHNFQPYPLALLAQCALIPPVVSCGNLQWSHYPDPHIHLWFLSWLPVARKDARQRTQGYEGRYVCECEIQGRQLATMDHLRKSGRLTVGDFGS